MAKEELHQLMEKMKSHEITQVEFFRGIMKILAHMDVHEEDLQGVTPLLLNFINRLIQNMEKRGA
ncbi:hypothetical protein Theam_1719 [Thermovibrio ammonificans HB-1]|uniref:Uncharacterized protein n=2 Tax=Thermovibrio ammonificans TaxID=228745 RepID=E8T5U9_THEA1|nr:hypothetical protein Theam_1719 [Thermovibrio ammonificans HB-1]